MRSDIGRSKRHTQEGITNCPQYRDGILLNSGNIAPDPTEDMDALPSAKAAGDLLLDLHHTDITFRTKSSYEDFVRYPHL